jgi:4-amino-4-deoxy-L-arabinose transferase-like glycosyltransferase
MTMLLEQRIRIGLNAWNILKENWALAVITLLGLGLRLWGINFGLPYTYAPDEATRMNVALSILKTGDLNPHWLGYPHLAFYINTVAFFAYFIVGRLLGIFATPADIPYPELITIGVGKLAMPSEFLLARGLSALFGTGAIVLIYMIGKQISKRQSVGLLSALLFAVSPAAVANSQLISLDSYGVFFLLLAFFWIYPILSVRTWKKYVLAGIGVGLAFSGKYNVGIIGITFLFAHFLRFGVAGFWRKELYIGLIATCLTFAVVNPFSVVDLSGFVFGLTLASGAQSQFTGSATNASQWYLSYLWNVEGWAIILAVCQAVRIVFSKTRDGLVLLSFPVLYFLFVSQFSVANDRTILPMIPFVDLLGVSFLVDVCNRLISVRSLPRGAVWAGLAAAVALLIIRPTQTAVAADLRLTQIDGRETARRWIEGNLPPGTRVAEEGYSPYIDTHRFVVQGVDTIIGHPPEWYVQNGFEYLILSQGMYGRFFADPQSYSSSIDQYKQFLSRFLTVALLNNNGYEVRIQKTDAILPSQRVGARFGNEGELIELVGYDDVAQTWMPGQPLKVKLTWRTIEQKSEPFEVELRLLDKDGREVGSARGDLFQGQGWREGMFSTEWTIPVQASAAPGAYQLEVNVIESRYDYRTPSRSWAGENLDRVALGPIKMSVIPPTAIELQTLQKVDVRFGEAIGLLGYTPPGDARLDSSLPLKLYWQSLAKPSTDYTVFVHLVDANGKVVTQVDAQPRGGAYSTSLWDASEIIADAYDLQVPADLAPGSYRVEIGLYEYPSLTRLPAVDAKGNSLGDHWVLPDPIQVVQ